MPALRNKLSRHFFKLALLIISCDSLEPGWSVLKCSYRQGTYSHKNYEEIDSTVRLCLVL